MKLKKLACVAMVSLMSTGLVACGSENNSTGNKSSEGEKTLSQTEN